MIFCKNPSLDPDFFLRAIPEKHNHVGISGFPGKSVEEFREVFQEEFLEEPQQKLVQESQLEYLEESNAEFLDEILG